MSFNISTFLKEKIVCFFVLFFGSDKNLNLENVLIEYFTVTQLTVTHLKAQTQLIHFASVFLCLKISGLDTVLFHGY